MKEYTLKKENNETLLTGVFDSEQLAWNVLCVRTANRVKKEDWLYLYNEDDNIVYSDKAFEVWRDLVEYELYIPPGIYNIKESFSKDTSVEEVWEVVRRRALKDNNHKYFRADLKLDGNILFTKELDFVFPTKAKEEVKVIDLLLEITKIKI